MDGVDIFEDFITLLSKFNKNGAPLMVNSFYIIDDEKQRGTALRQQASTSMSGSGTRFS